VQAAGDESDPRTMPERRHRALRAGSPFPRRSSRRDFGAISLASHARHSDATGASGVSAFTRVLKRGVDIGVSLGLILLVLPVVSVISLVIRIESPGPVFFRARRVGRDGHEFEMLKFRKMWHGATGLRLTTGGDSRFTRIGSLLAKLKLDELPQLWNVLLGDMSLIGPRPEDPHFVALHEREYRAILRVRPGVTGLSQLAFAEESDILDDSDPLTHYLERILPQKMKLDGMYATGHNIRSDLRILFWTLMAVVGRRQVAVHRATGQMNFRKRRPDPLPLPPVVNVRSMSSGSASQPPAMTNAFTAVKADATPSRPPHVAGP
jgi:lipopolysaccharide/colanic/teichoic acid biosynthesis glycosyltransferase